LRVSGAQEAQDALGFLGLVFSQCQLAKGGQSNRQIGVAQQQFFNQLARQVGSIL
jgi:hypothetical protein